MLKRRISKLEALVDGIAARTISAKPRPTAAELEQFRSNLQIGEYSHWRYQKVSLQELLALARDDTAHANENPRTAWSPGYREAEKGRWVDVWPQVAVREFEIRILERDGLIDSELAKRLRTNLQAFLGHEERLADLPVNLALDQATLEVAREKCPRRESLPPNVQLELLQADYAHDLAKRRARESTIPDPLTSRLAKGLDALRDKTYEQQVDELKARIRASEAGRQR
jgi:hypothetical protein